MFTASGRISLITDADEETSKRLVALERNLSEDAEFKGPGDIEHSRYVIIASEKCWAIDFFLVGGLQQIPEVLQTHSAQQ